MLDFSDGLPEVHPREVVFLKTAVLIPGLVNVYIAMENHHFSWENPL